MTKKFPREYLVSRAIAATALAVVGLTPVQAQVPQIPTPAQSSTEVQPVAFAKTGDIIPGSIIDKASENRSGCGLPPYMDLSNRLADSSSIGDGLRNLNLSKPNVFQKLSDGSWVAVPEIAYDALHIMIAPPTMSVLDKEISATRSHLTASVTPDGIVRVTENGQNKNLVAYFGSFKGVATWNGEGTLDLNTGQESWNFSASVTATAPGGRCTYHATMKINRQAKREILKDYVVQQQPQQRPSRASDCTQHFTFNPDAKPILHPPMKDWDATQANGHMLHISSGNDGSQLIPFGIAFSDPLKVTNATPNEWPVIVQNMIGWSGVAEYRSDSGRIVKWSVPSAPPTPFSPPPWLDKPVNPPPPYYLDDNHRQAVDSPDLKVPLYQRDEKGDVLRLTNVDFTKEFVTFFGCTNPDVDRKLFPNETDEEHWIRRVAILEWNVRYVGKVHIKDAPIEITGQPTQYLIDYVSFSPTADAGVHAGDYKTDYPKRAVVTGPVANQVQNSYGLKPP